MKLIGIDGAKLGRWVIATCDGPDPNPPVFELTDNLADVFQRAASGQAIVVIDVPIGILSGEPAAAGRACDREARKVVGPVRASSVFNAPSRELFGCQSQSEASARNREVCGKGFTCQSFGILRRIEAVDAVMNPALQSNVREGHPEVTFARLRGGVVQSAKKTQEGREERLVILESHGVMFDLDAERHKLKRGLVSRDDIIDAVAMMVSARRVHDQDADVLGGTSRDSRGLLMQMWA
jgi:predicted RNase H-like nuclease